MLMLAAMNASLAVLWLLLCKHGHDADDTCLSLLHSGVFKVTKIAGRQDDKAVVDLNDYSFKGLTPSER
jgi:hypothetical protein